MRTWTFEEVRNKVLKDLDLEGEDDVTLEEFIGYVNEAIDEAEAEIHKIHEDYFLKRTTLSLISGQADYTLPEDIYANKIRGMIYTNGSTWTYVIKRLKQKKELNMFLRMAEANISPSNNEELSYKIVNDSGEEGPRIRFFPTPQETATDIIQLWYLRNATRVPLVGEVATDDEVLTEDEVNATPIDIPEFTQFVIQFAKVRCMQKEHNPMLDSALSDLAMQRKMMVDTLTGMVPDDDDEVEPDMSFYMEHS